MDPFTKDKNLSRRVTSVLGFDPNDEAGFSEDDLRKLDAANVFRPGARGPWTKAGKPSPELLTILEKLESIQNDLTAARDSLRVLGLRNWAGAIQKVIELYEPLLTAFQKRLQR